MNEQNKPAPKPISKKQKGTLGAAAVLICGTFTPVWEGMDTVARRDAIGTGHPITYCYGMTSERGQVKEGTHFTKADCDRYFKPALLKYWREIDPCIKTEIPEKAAAALLDAAWNAGSPRVCSSPMLAQMNAGNVEAGCNAFAGWIIRSDGVVRKGLIARRSGVAGDHRKTEKQLCLDGWNEFKAARPKVTLFTKVMEYFEGLDMPWWQALAKKILFWRG